MLQLHAFDVELHHGRIGDPSAHPYGNGVALWFEIDDFDAAASRAQAVEAAIVTPPHRNPPDGPGGPAHRELWLRDPDGYLVVLASPDGSRLGRARASVDSAHASETWAEAGPFARATSISLLADEFPRCAKREARMATERGALRSPSSRPEFRREERRPVPNHRSRLSLRAYGRRRLRRVWDHFRARLLRGLTDSPPMRGSRGPPPRPGVDDAWRDG